MSFIKHMLFIVETDPVTQALLVTCCAAALVYVALLAAFKISGRR